MVAVAITRLSDRRPVFAEDNDQEIIEERIARMLNGENFWEAVHFDFIHHELARRHVRSIVVYGLIETRRDYKALLTRYNMPQDDHARFRLFLRRHHILNQDVVH